MVSTYKFVETAFIKKFVNHGNYGAGKSGPVNKSVIPGAIMAGVEKY